jgi:hypothetical protein
MHPEFASKKTLEFSVKITATNNKKNETTKQTYHVTTPWAQGTTFLLCLTLHDFISK